MTRRKPSFECPHCGADVPAGRAVCRECGSDARTGWLDDEEIDYQSLDIPQGWGPDQEPTRGFAAVMRRWAFVAIAILSAMALLYITVLRR